MGIFRDSRVVFEARGSSVAGFFFGKAELLLELRMELRNSVEGRKIAGNSSAGPRTWEGTEEKRHRGEWIEEDVA